MLPVLLRLALAVGAAARRAADAASVAWSRIELTNCEGRWDRGVNTRKNYRQGYDCRVGSGKQAANVFGQA
jgi:hypothetical protein